MPSIAVHNQEGKSASNITLNESVFGVAVKSALIHQVYVALAANLRSSRADTKNKGEVRGGGKKPWKQKGTGRARHGSIRSPIWKGGGITFGPLSIRNYKQKINKKMNRLALCMALSGKVAQTELFVVENYPSTGKTKELLSFLQKFSVLPKTVLLITDEKDSSLKSAANLPKVDVARAIDLNVRDVMDHRFLFATPNAIATLEKRGLAK